MLRSGSRAGVWLALLALLSACGGSSKKQHPDGAAASAAAGESGSSSQGGTSGSGGSNAAGAANAGSSGSSTSPDPCYGGCSEHPVRPLPLPRPLCPEVEPAAGDSCENAGLRCGYGDSEAPQCRSVYDCTGGVWVADGSLSQRYSCEPLPADYCPAEPQHEAACVLGTPGLGCHYGELTCVCRVRQPAPGKPGTWICFGPPANPSCPAVAPNLGEGCDERGLACNYDTDGCNAAPISSLFCFDGAWEQGEGYACAGG